jgi:hypothetical protein
MARILSQHVRLNVRRTMYPRVTGPADSQHVGLVESQARILGPWLQVVSVQALRSLLRRAATTAGKVVSCIDRLTELLPVPRFVESLTLWRSAALPRTVSLTDMASHSRLTTAPDRNAEPNSVAVNRSSRNAAVPSDLVHCPAFGQVCSLQPFRVLVRSRWMPVPLNVDRPAVLVLAPSNRRTTAALTIRHWLSGWWQVSDWLAAFAMGMRLLGITQRNTPLAKDVMYGCVGDAEAATEFRTAEPSPICLGGRIQTDDLVTLVPGQLRVVVGVAA